ncbi:hypothetical protein [Nocardiopsis flavescens]
MKVWALPGLQRAWDERDAATVVRLVLWNSELSQAKLAQILGLAQSTVSDAVSGKSRMKRPSTRDAVFDGLRTLRPPTALQIRAPSSEISARSIRLAGVGATSSYDLYESELLHHLGEQWHHLVKTDNLLGPRAALRGVYEQIRIVTELIDVHASNSTLRQGLLSLAARYAESASWLCEDSADLAQAHKWSGQAVQWAYEAQDEIMLAWAYFRKSQQEQNPEHSLALVTTAQRHRDSLPSPMRAALLQHQAATLARTGDGVGTQMHFDEALEWAVDTDTEGDARAGHGSFCTPDYIALERARAWTLLGSPERAVAIYERVIPRLPVVYQRDRGVALARCALAHRATGEVERAADLAQQAWEIAHVTGTGRAVNDIVALADDLRPHRAVSAVGDLLTRVEETRDN